MKSNKKYQNFFLITAVLLFCGRELVHPFFHSGELEHVARFSVQSGKCGKTVISNGENDNSCSYFSDSEHVCPICVSTADKSKEVEKMDIRLLIDTIDTYPFLYKSTHSHYLGTAVSRAPPVAR